MRKLLLTLAICLQLPLLAQQKDVKIENLSQSSKLVRIDTKWNYLLLPVEESQSSWTANIIVDTEPGGSFTVPLAVNKVDYWVPFNLSPYKGSKLILSFSSSAGRVPRNEQAQRSQPAPKEAICWDLIKVSDSFDSSNTEMKWRPNYHFTPAYGWMNDPNGLVYKDGEWHLFYQYNPYASVWGNMNWGHAVSRDFVNWEHLPVAIAPDALGTIFSGSAVVDKNNTAGFGAGAIVAIYTNSGVRQMQSIAYSTDNGRTFTKYAGNPVLLGDIADFRDPKVFWNDEIGKWNLVLAAGHEARIYSSPNLKDWTFESGFGEGYGNHGGVWECPDLIPVKVEGTNTRKWVLIVNVNPGGPAGGSATQYFVGDFDGKTFTCESAKETTKWMDWGKDHYATVTFSNAPDDRIIALAWMSNWQYGDSVPTQQFRSANSIPRDLSLYIKNGEHYLAHTPSAEMDAARGAAIKKNIGAVTASGKVVKDIFPGKDNSAEIYLDIVPGTASSLDIELLNSKGETVVCSYDFKKGIFSCDRTKSGLVEFHKDFPAVASVSFDKAKSYSLRLFIDRCSIEAFDGKGRFVMTNILFPTEDYTDIRFVSKGGKANVKSMVVYPINL